MEPDDLQFRNWKQTVEESLARSAVLLELSNRRMDRLERNLTRLARLGLKARSRVNGQVAEHEIRMNRVEITLAEITDKLNGLIAYQMGLQKPQNPPQQ